jgi:hypothetical protein
MKILLNTERRRKQQIQSKQFFKINYCLLRQGAQICMLRIHHNIEHWKKSKSRFQEAWINKHISWNWWQLITGRLLLADPPTSRIGTTCIQSMLCSIAHCVTIISHNIIMILFYIEEFILHMCMCWSCSIVCSWPLTSLYTCISDIGRWLMVWLLFSS